MDIESACFAKKHPAHKAGSIYRVVWATTLLKSPLADPADLIFTALLSYSHSERQNIFSHLPGRADIGDNACRTYRGPKWTCTLRIDRVAESLTFGFISLRYAVFCIYRYFLQVSTRYRLTIVNVYVILCDVFVAVTDLFFRRLLLWQWSR